MEIRIFDIHASKISSIKAFKRTIDTAALTLPLAIFLLILAIDTRQDESIFQIIVHGKSVPLMLGYEPMNEGLDKRGWTTGTNPYNFSRLFLLFSLLTTTLCSVQLTTTFLRVHP